MTMGISPRPSVSSWSDSCLMNMALIPSLRGLPPTLLGSHELVELGRLVLDLHPAQGPFYDVVLHCERLELAQPGRFRVVPTDQLVGLLVALGMLLDEGADP